MFDDYDHESQSSFEARYTRLIENTPVSAELLCDKAIWEAKQLELDAGKADLDALYTRAGKIAFAMSQEIHARRERASDEEACRRIAQASISGTGAHEITYARMSPTALRAMAQLTNM